MSKPSEALQQPEAEDPLASWIPYFVGGNFISPAYYINAGIKSLTDVDVFGWASQQVAGDWEAVKKAGVAAGNLADFNTAFGDTIKADWQSMLEETWRGNAADQADTFFQSLTGAVKWQVSALNEIERTLNNISNSMVNLARVLGDILQSLVDMAIMWLAQLAAASLAASSLVASGAAPAMYALAAVQALAIYTKFASAVGIVATAFQTVVGLGAAALQLSSGDLQEFPQLGDKNYDHPGA
ncbi:WXG100 family type VII secretion target [Nocardia sp. NPDC048505]|uniref:WXG100 family type VII secretion target n=1 Tax=unclassified Nocardia TaxID=2637762 RepID=UPI0033C2C923